MEYADFVEQVRARTGFDSDRDARRAVEATLEVLGQHLPVSDREEVCRKVPGEIAQILRRRRYDGDVDAEMFFELVGELEGVAIGFALEHADVVCQVLAESSGAEGRAHLTLGVSPSMKWLFEPRRRSSTPPPHVHDHLVMPGQGHTLASGHTGSYRPIYLARGTAHDDSVVGADEPHGDVKLSSTRGLSAERFHETLASGKPGAKRSLSDAKG
jgi:uncharacterized protein (DUF2267 family)